MRMTLERPLLLRGNVVQPDGTAFDRYVLVEKGIIQSVTRRRPPRSDAAVYLETGRNDWIFPGLIDLHTHTSSNLLPLWDPGRRFGNRYEWRGDAQYKKEVGRFFKNLEAAPDWKLKGAFAELQAIAGGTTVLQEDFDLDGKIGDGKSQILCRGTGRPKDLGSKPAKEVFSVIDFFYPNKKAKPWQPEETDKFKSYLADRKRLQACLAHLAEGRPGILEPPDPYTRREFEAFIEHPEMQDAGKVRKCRLALIHCCGIDPADPRHLEFMRQRHIGVVWSPVSNLLLYGETPDVEALVQDGILVGLGSDWSPSGSKHVWDEAKFARFYFDALNSDVSDAQIYQMVTINAAQLLGLDNVGRIASGCFGDFFILRSPRESDSAMEVFFGVEDRHVRAVIIGGRPIYGQRDLLSRFGVDLQPLPEEEGTAVADKAVHLPGINIADAIRDVEQLMKKQRGLKRSNLLVSSDTPYRERLRRLRAEVLEWGWKVQRKRHQGWKSRLASKTQVPAFAVQLSSGFKRAGTTSEEFRSSLADTSIPSTIQLQAPLGLKAYLVAALPDDKPETVPDQVALACYESQEAYQALQSTLGGRVWAELQRSACAQSWSGFPQRLKRSVGEGLAYCLFEEPCDWQRGASMLLVGTRPEGQTDPSFRQSLYDFFNNLRKDRSKGLESVVFVVQQGCLICWEHWTDEASAKGSPLDGLAQILDAVVRRRADPLLLEPDLTRDCRAKDKLAGGDCLNLIFTRQAEKR